MDVLNCNSMTNKINNDSKDYVQYSIIGIYQVLSIIYYIIIIVRLNNVCTLYYSSTYLPIVIVYNIHLHMYLYLNYYIYLIILYLFVN